MADQDMMAIASRKSWLSIRHQDLRANSVFRSLLQSLWQLTKAIAILPQQIFHFLSTLSLLL